MCYYEHSELNHSVRRKKACIAFFWDLHSETYKRKRNRYSKDKLGKLLVANKKKIAGLNYSPENSLPSPIITEILPFSLRSFSLYESDFTLHIKTLILYGEGIILVFFIGLC